MSTNNPADPPVERLHGDVQRQAVRLRTPETPPPQHVSWYKIDPGENCSLHVHTGKTETWLLIDGEGEVQIGDKRLKVAVGDMVVTEPGTPHGLRNTGQTPLRFVNIVSARGDAAITTTEVEGP